MKKGMSEFEKNLAGHGIRRILARAKHPQTNDNLERLHGELERMLDIFKGRGRAALPHPAA